MSGRASAGTARRRREPEDTGAHAAQPLVSARAVEVTRHDRVGIAWRREIAQELRRHMDQLDVIQLITEDWLDASDASLAAVRALRSRASLHLHGVSLGLASVVPVDRRRLARVARVIDRIQPERWSEHLAFVRGGGREIGHLAAPPRTKATLEGTAANVARAAHAIGWAPELENAATLFDPPGSEMSEAMWIERALRGSGAGLLLDLHNLYANARNAGVEPEAMLCALPLDRVAVVHIAGGRVVAGPSGRRRVLDDHCHAVPKPVFTLLSALAARVSGPLDVILEREGRFPALDVLLDELRTARAALAAGRAQRSLAVRRNL